MTNPTLQYTQQFVQEFLGESFDFRAHGRYMREMKRFTNPDGDEVPIAPEHVFGCLRAMKSGLFGWDGKIDSAWCITYGDPPYFKQYFEWVKEPPSWYDQHLVSLWERITGKIAYPDTPKSDIIFSLPSRPI